MVKPILNTNKELINMIGAIIVLLEKRHDRISDKHMLDALAKLRDAFFMYNMEHKKSYFSRMGENFDV